MVKTYTLSIESQGGFFSQNISDDVKEYVSQAGIRNGIVVVFYLHTTGGLVIIEHEAGFLVDIEDTLERLVPTNGEYAHHLRQYDMNGAAHVRNAFIPPSVVIPIIDGILKLGEYQDILLLDMQPDPKRRDIILQFVGE